ncbi:MAG TPA: putative ABC exporter domain-containing protein, partial [Humisphaera sp.]
MFPAALRDLMLLQARGVVRQAVRRAKTPRGAIFFVVGILVFIVWLLPGLLTAQIGGKSEPAHVRNVMPLVLLGLTLITTLTSAGEKAIAFTGGETDLLFPGPFSRRQLLLYKVVKGAFVSLLTGGLASVLVYRHSTYWFACFVGCVLTLLFLQLAGTVVLLAGEAAGRRWKTGGRLALAAAVVALLVWGLRSVAGPDWWDALLTDPRAVLQKFSASPGGRVLLAPFGVLTNVLTAERLWPDLPLWAAAGAGINVLLVLVMMRLDAAFLEAAGGASERRHSMIQRFRSGGALAIAAKATARRSLPGLPRWGGAGVVAWRQLTHASRAGRMLLFLLVILAGSVGPAAVAAARTSNPAFAAGMPLGMLAWMSVLLAAVLRFDFRADLDAIDTLKSLPLSPSAIAAGQLVAPTLVMTLLHWVVIAATLAATGGRPEADLLRGPLLVAAGVCPAFNLLMFAAENLIFLLAPSRPGAAGPGDFSMLGRQIVTLVVRTTVVALGATVAGGAAAGAYLLTGG